MVHLPLDFVGRRRPESHNTTVSRWRACIFPVGRPSLAHLSPPVSSRWKCSSTEAGRAKWLASCSEVALSLGGHRGGWLAQSHHSVDAVFARGSAEQESGSNPCEKHGPQGLG